MFLKFLVILTSALAMASTASRGNASDTASYEVTVEFHWSEKNYPLNYPSSAHWSSMFVATHDERYSLFADGNTATTGMALLATNGRTSILQAEFAEAKRRRRVGLNQTVSPPQGGSGIFRFNIEATVDFPMLSFATMIAPSPDWFSGATSVSLRTEAGWKDAIRLPLFVWDAGADNGMDFVAQNDETQPMQSVRLLTHPSFLHANGIHPIGIAKFVRKSQDN